MYHNRTAAGEFSRLDGLRQGFINRCEKYARFTVPRLAPENGYEVNNTELTQDYQSVGAQGTYHLVNKLMLTLFSPSRPFFRVDLPLQEKQKLLAQLGSDESVLEAAFGEGEQAAIKLMDTKPIRPKLFEALINLIVTGNVAFHLAKDGTARVFGIKSYVARRTGKGELRDLIVREKLRFDELEDEVQAALLAGRHKAKYANMECDVELYHWVQRQPGGSYTESTWVDNHRLDGKFEGSYKTYTECPWRALTWNLADGDDYGTGHVEAYAGDFSALSALSEAQLNGAILASEFRWLVNPGGMTKPEDLEGSENGAVLPGVEGDVVLVTNSKQGDLQVTNMIINDYTRRIGQGFLLGSAVTRDAERVTAEEIRQQAAELETGLGGVYTRLAVDLQGFLARWLIEQTGVSLNGTKLEVRVVTGLDAMSRNGDLNALRLALQDLAGLQNLGPALGELNINAVVTAIFLGHGLTPRKYVKTPEQRQQDEMAAQQQQAQQVAVEQGSRAAADQVVRETA